MGRERFGVLSVGIATGHRRKCRPDCPWQALRTRSKSATERRRGGRATQGAGRSAWRLANHPAALDPSRLVNCLDGVSQLCQSGQFEVVAEEHER